MPQKDLHSPSRQDGGARQVAVQEAGGEVTDEFVSELKKALRTKSRELDEQADRLAEITGYSASEMVVERKAMALAYGTVLDALELEDVALVLGLSQRGEKRV
jgi:hypothetical protein